MRLSNYKMIRSIISMVYFSMLSMLSCGTLYADKHPDISEINAATISNHASKVVENALKSAVQIQVVGFDLRQGERGKRGLAGRFRTSGSGFIIDEEGYIITNSHVISGAQSIRVILAHQENDSPSNSILKAKIKSVTAVLVGKDDETDLAVLKIEADNLSALKLADIDQVKVGQFVWAIGSPLGLNGSVTMGVISTVARQLKADDPMIYVQSDAAVNPGSSGGALIDANSEVIGVNSTILTRGGGSDGITLSVPAHIVDHVYKMIRKNGRVIRGDIQVNAQTITPMMSDALGLEQDTGVILSDVIPNGQAHKAGLLPGDIILTLDGKTMENARQFIVNLYQKSIGKKVKINALQKGKSKEFIVDIRERPIPQEPLDSRGKMSVPQFGIIVANADDRAKGFKRGRGGVMVVAKWENSTNQFEQIKTNDIIYHVNKTGVYNLSDMQKALFSLDRGDPVVLHIERDSRLKFINFYLD